MIIPSALVYELAHKQDGIPRPGDTIFLSGTCTALMVLKEAHPSLGLGMLMVRGKDADGFFERDMSYEEWNEWRGDATQFIPHTSPERLYFP